MITYRGTVATASRARRQSIQNAQASRASGDTIALSRSTGPWAMTVCTELVSSWTALRMRPEVESVNQASGAREMRATMSRRSRSRRVRSAKWVMSSARKYRNRRAE